MYTIKRKIKIKIDFFLCIMEKQYSHKAYHGYLIRKKYLLLYQSCQKNTISLEGIHISQRNALPYDVRRMRKSGNYPKLFGEKRIS